MLFFLLCIYSIIWSWVLWYIGYRSFCSVLLWLFRVFCTFIKVLGFFPNKLCIEGNYFNIYDKHIVTWYWMENFKVFILNLEKISMHTFITCIQHKSVREIEQENKAETTGKLCSFHYLQMILWHINWKV
jgi:hypothetical protein